MKNASLVDLYHRFYVETDWLLNDCAHSLTVVYLHDENERTFRLSGEMAIVRLHDAWSRFCRRLIIMSAGYEPYTRSGVKLRLAPGIKKPADVIPVLLSKYKKARYEPKWYNAIDCCSAANQLLIQNRSTIIAALGATSSPSNEVRLVRNFFAHRGKDTADLLRSHLSSVGTSSICLEDLAGEIISPGIMRVEHWVNDLRLIAEAAIN